MTTVAMESPKLSEAGASPARRANRFNFRCEGASEPGRLQIDICLERYQSSGR